MEVDLLTPLVPELADHEQAKMGGPPWHPFRPGYRRKDSDPLLYKRSILLTLLVGSTMQSIQFPVGAHDKYCRQANKN